MSTVLTFWLQQMFFMLILLSRLRRHMLETILYLELKLEIFENIDDNEYTHQYKQNKQ